MEVLPLPSISGLRKLYPCPECGRNFKRNSHLVRHKRLHTGEKPYKCPDCGKSFRQSTDVNTHRRIHTGETPYQCNQCGKSFRYRTGLVKHLRCHEEEKSYNCLECGKSFNCDSVPPASRPRCHAGAKLYKCSDCEKNIQKKANLVVHLTLPTAEDPYSCPDCGKEFKCNFQLIKHRNLHTRFLIPNPNALCSVDPSVKDTESPESSCEGCDDTVVEEQEDEAAFSAKSFQTLLGRLQGLDSRCGEGSRFGKWRCKKPGINSGESAEEGSTDSPLCERLFRSERKHLCFICGKRFRFESHLVTHERIHTGEKPFQCSICNKSFRDRSDLSKHQKTHSGEKPYKCLDCGKSFHHQLTFVRHQRLHPRQTTYEQSHVYFAILPSYDTGAERSNGAVMEPAESLGFHLKQKDPSPLYTVELAEGTKLYLTST